MRGDGESVLGARFDQELFGDSKQRERQTRSQKRVQRRKYAEVKGADEWERELNNLKAAELKVWQEEDETLKEVRRAADGVVTMAGDGFFRRDGVIYRRWMPKEGIVTGEVEQLVLPRRCRNTILKLAHSIPLAGHLGDKKTAERVKKRFYWPTLYKDVENYCKACEECQKCSPGRGTRVPLVPLPIMTEPFQRIAMDIVGPLPRSRMGNKYILVVCDYATRFPEAFALKSIDAEHVAEALMSLFSRMGVPKEILTDQGTNFTSRLLEKLYQLLGVKAIRTSPYHPQTDGLVERFNGTLKAMLWKCDEGRKGLGLTPTVCALCIQRSTTGYNWILAIRVAVRTSSSGAAGHTEGDLGGGGGERGECSVLYLISAGEASRNDGVGEGEFYQGEGSTESMV